MSLYNYFENNIGHFISLKNLMHCKQGPKEKMTNCIGRFKHLHAQLPYHVCNIDIHHMLNVIL